MNITSTIAVVGGGGRTGQFLVRQLLQRQYPIRVLLRKPESFLIRDPLLEIVPGDVLIRASVDHLLQGCSAVISTVGQRPGEPLVAYQATVSIMEAMKAYGIRRYILMAGINVDTPPDKKGPATLAATTYMKSNFPVIQEDRQKAYKALCDSEGIDWTLVRVPMIEFAQATDGVNVSLEDCPGTGITAGNIANFLVGQLNDKEYYGQAPFIANA